MTVSIIIPCYNVADFVAESVTSAFGQSHRPLEVICVDNNSTDGTLAVLHSLLDRYPELVVLEEHTPGAPAARNAGLAKANGHWIQFLDADDLLMPDKIAAQLDLISRSEVAPFVAAAYERLDLSTGTRSVVGVADSAWHGLLNNRLGITTANLFIRSALMTVGGFDPQLKSSQEYDLMFRLMTTEGLPILDRTPRSCIRSRTEGSISATDVEGNKHRYLQLVSRICRHLKVHEEGYYQSIGQEWFQAIFQRIRLNAIDGYPDSAVMYDDILPKGFSPAANGFTPLWFRIAMKVFGYGLTEGFRSSLRP